MSNKVTGGSGQFEWFRSIGATEEAVMVLNDQPMLFTTLVVVLISLIVLGLLIGYIHFATRKPEQKKKKGEKKGGKSGGLKTLFPPALRR
ncbi:hypothetical protein IMZ48_20195 [Candidatus Bathyarchaeota archaeon]|nr:hypothetical protein [Candidatus Bathyarchaeota archaeon]